jgi:hypothetical protein
MRNQPMDDSDSGCWSHGGGGKRTRTHPPIQQREQFPMQLEQYGKNLLPGAALAINAFSSKICALRN